MYDRLKFLKNVTKSMQQKEPQNLLAEKMKKKKDIQKNIDKFAKQETIIIKVLDIINNSEGKELFEMPDSKLEKDLAVVKQQWTQKRDTYEQLKRMKQTHQDIDYFAEYADF